LRIGKITETGRNDEIFMTPPIYIYAQYFPAYNLG